jgi:hypothetical protein
MAVTIHEITAGPPTYTCDSHGRLMRTIATKVRVPKWDRIFGSTLDFRSTHAHCQISLSATEEEITRVPECMSVYTVTGGTNDARRKHGSTEENARPDHNTG